MASSRQQEDAMRLNVEVFKYIPGVPQGLISQIQAQAEGLDIALNERFMRKLRSTIMSWLPPLRSVVAWRQHMAVTKVIYQNHENQKKEFRQVFKRLAGDIEGIYPAGLRERALPDIKDTVERQDNKTFGIDPFRHGREQTLFEKELLQYQGPYTWASFSKVKVECGDVIASDPGKRKMILSLTVMALLKEMKERGCTWDHMVKVYTDFFKECQPNIASRINSLQETDLRQMLNIIEVCIDIPAEIKMVEKAIKNIYRDPQDSIKVPGDSFGAKQRLLYDLRAIQTQDKTPEEVKDQEARINQITVEFCLDLVTEEVRSIILEIKMRKGTRASMFTLNDFYYEVQELERKNPSYRLKDRKHIKSSHTALPVKIYNTEANNEEYDYDQDENDNQPQDDYYNQADYNYAEEYPEDPEQEDLEESEYFDEEEEEEPEEVPDSSGCFFTRGGGRGRARGRGQVSRLRGRGRGRAPPRQQGQVRQVQGQRPRGGPSNVRRNNNFPSQGRSGPSRPKGQSSHCIRCGESSHSHGQCRKFALYYSERCPLCPTLNPSKQPIFHPRALCPYTKSQESNYRSPRNRSPSSWLAHGFDETGRARTGQSDYVKNPAKNSL